MADKYLGRNATTGLVTETEGTVTGGSPAQAGDLVALDQTGRLDQSLMPVGLGADTYAGTAGEALAAGDFVYVRSDGAIAKASAATTGTQADGFVLAASANGASAVLYFEGRNTAVTGLTPGSRIYLSDTTPGGFTSTPVSGPGKKHQFLGRAITADSIAFEGDDAIVLA